MIDPKVQALLDQASDVCGDSRWVTRGAVFIAMQGEKRHGLIGLDEAIERGASAIIHDGQADASDLARLSHVAIPTLAWPSLKTDLPTWLKAFWKDPMADLTLHAVTGTNGKSSVAWLLAQALDGAMIGTLGAGKPFEHHKAELTTPSIFDVYRQLAQFRHQGIRHVVLEASSHALVQGRLAGLAFETVIFTNLGHDHLDYHGDRVRYGQAKRRLFVDFPSTHQLINIDDAFGFSLCAELKAHAKSHQTVLSYSQASTTRADVEVTEIPKPPAELSDGLQVTLRLSDSVEVSVQSKLMGSVNAYNLLITAQVMHWAGFDVAQIIQRLSTLRSPPGRMELIQACPCVSTAPRPKVLVDYAHSPDALKQALLMARQTCTGQLWVVFGCGGDRDVSKRAPMGRIAESLADRVVITDDNPRHESSLSIIRAIQSGMRQPERARVVADREQAIRWTIEQATEHDVVLLAGKGHETEQLIGDRRLPLDDRRIAQHALEALCADRKEAC